MPKCAWSTFAIYTLLFPPKYHDSPCCTRHQNVPILNCPSRGTLSLLSLISYTTSPIPMQDESDHNRPCQRYQAQVPILACPWISHLCSSLVSTLSPTPAQDEHEHDDDDPYHRYQEVPSLSVEQAEAAFAARLSRPPHSMYQPRPTLPPTSSPRQCSSRRWAELMHCAVL